MRRAALKVAVGLPQVGGDVGAVLAAAVAAEDAGAWGVWVFDNLGPLLRPERPSLEGWSLLGPLARATSRVRLVMLLSRAGLRPPALVARMASVVQAASGGRFVLGLGVGDARSRAEERRFGLTAPPRRAERMALVEETVRQLRSPDAPLRPEVEPPPVWIGGTNADLSSLAARMGAAWHAWGVEPAELGRRARAAAQLERWWGGMFDPATAEAVAGSLALAGAAGVTWMVPSRRERSDRPALLELVRVLGRRT